MIIRPVSSPCAPAQGLKVKCFIPVISASRRSIQSRTARAPFTVSGSCKGCRPWKVGMEAISSLILGLYFIVQLPSG